jgi:hypothetical protein
MQRERRKSQEKQSEQSQRFHQARTPVSNLLFHPGSASR